MRDRHDPRAVRQPRAVHHADLIRLPLDEPGMAVGPDRDRGGGAVIDGVGTTVIACVLGLMVPMAPIPIDAMFDGSATGKLRDVPLFVNQRSPPGPAVIPTRAPVGLRQEEFGDGVRDRVDLPDPIGGELGEPEIAVRSGGDPIGETIRVGTGNIDMACVVGLIMPIDAGPSVTRGCRRARS